MRSLLRASWLAGDGGEPAGFGFGRCGELVGGVDLADDADALGVGAGNSVVTF